MNAPHYRDRDGTGVWFRPNNPSQPLQLEQERLQVTFALALADSSDDDEARPRAEALAEAGAALARLGFRGYGQE